LWSSSILIANEVGLLMYAKFANSQNMNELEKIDSIEILHLLQLQIL